MSAFSSPSELQPDLGAFGTETDRRLVLLVFAILAASLYILHVELVTTFLQGLFTHCLQTSLANPGLDFHAVTPDGLSQVCSVVPERWQSLGMLFGLLVLLSLGLLVDWWTPRWHIWRAGLMPLEQYQHATIEQNGKLVHIVTFLDEVRAAYLPELRLRYVSNRRTTPSLPSAFGGLGQAYVLVPLAAIALFQQNTAAFQAMVLHELAHFSHRDVQKVAFARALTLVFVLLILLPFLGFLLWSLVFLPTSLAPVAKVEFVLSQFWGMPLMAGLIWLLYRAVRRAREVAADVQASYWAHTNPALAETLLKLGTEQRAWWRVVLSAYPDERVLNVREPGRLFRLRRWEALATGITASLSLPTSYFTALTLFSALNLTNLPPAGLILVGAAGSLVLCGLVVAVVGQMIWRAMLLVKLRGGDQLVGTGRLGGYLAVGLVLGFLFSLQFTPFLIYYHITWQVLVVYFGPWLLLLALLLAGFCRWLAVLAGAWLEVIDRRQMARWVSVVNLVIASIVLATGLAVVALLCLVTLGYLLQGISFPALLQPVQLQAEQVRAFYGLMFQWLAFDFLPLPGVALGLTVLWALPLVSRLWHRRRVLSHRYAWALASVGQQVPPMDTPDQFNWGLAGETALVLGVLFCALFLLFHQLSLAVASAEQLYPHVLALTALPLVGAAFWQGGLAVLLSRETEARGIVNVLVGAFLAGLVIAAGCFLIYLLFGGTLGYPVAGDQFWPFCWLVLAWGSIGTHALLLALDRWPGKGWRGWTGAVIAESSPEIAPRPMLDGAYTRTGRRKRRWLWLISLLLIIIALLLPRYASKPTPVAFTGIVQNGDFEVPKVPVGQFNEYIAGQTFGGWTVAVGSIDLVDEHYWQAGHGQQSVDMDGDSAGTLYQDVPTRAGGTYSLAFSLAANPECGETVKGLQVWWDGKLLDTLQVSPRGYSDQRMGWHHSLAYATHMAVEQKFPYVVRASVDVTRLEFVSLTPGYCGAAIDLVSVVETSVE